MIVESIHKESKMIVLRGENDDEKILLATLGEEGVRVCTTGSVLGIISPKTSEQIGIYLGRSQQSAIAFALGLADYMIGETEVDNLNLLKKLTEPREYFPEIKIATAQIQPYHFDAVKLIKGLNEKELHELLEITSKITDPLGQELIKKLSD